MGYNAPGFSNSKSKASSSTKNSNQRPYKIDKLVTINSYDLVERQIVATDSDGRVILIQVRPDTISRNQKRSAETQGSRPQAPKWEGYLIDQRMAEHLKAGQKIIVEAAERVSTTQRNGISVGLFMVDRIFNPADGSPEKTFEGLFSISAYQNHVFNVFHWENKSIDLENQSELLRIMKTLDEGSQAYLNKDLRPHMGIQFRAFLPSITENGQTYCPVIDTSPPFDWISRKLNDQQEVIEPGRPLDSKKLKELISDEQDGYLAYIRREFPAHEYPGLRVEITPYMSYRAGPRSRYMAIPDRQFDPLYRLANTQSRLSIHDQKFIHGQNVAVRGVLQLTADAVNMQDRTFKSRNIATRLHATGPQGHVQSWIRTSDGLTTRPHANLKLVPLQPATPGERVTIQTAPSHTNSSMSSYSSHSAPSDSQYTPESLQDLSWDDDIDPFSDGSDLRSQLNAASSQFSAD